MLKGLAPPGSPDPSSILGGGAAGGGGGGGGSGMDWSNMQTHAAKLWKHLDELSDSGLGSCIVSYLCCQGVIIPDCVVQVHEQRRLVFKCPL